MNSNYCGIEINNYDYKDLILEIKKTIVEKKKISLTGINVNTINLLFELPNYKSVLNSFSILHLDGIGLYLFAKWKKNKVRFKKRITGSDLYIELLEEILINKWRVFFFGDEDNTLKSIKTRNPNLNIVGLQNGFSYELENVITEINNSKTDILFVGMGAPKQEYWIYNNIDKLNVKVIIAVGEGIKIFSGTKVRGPKIMQKMGFEWIARLVNNPSVYWRRYILGIPQFIFRVLNNRI